VFFAPQMREFSMHLHPDELINVHRTFEIELEWTPWHPRSPSVRVAWTPQVQVIQTHVGRSTGLYVCV
jgi:hypothetical protein